MIRNKANAENPLIDLSIVDNDHLLARSENGTQEVLFKVNRAKSHLGFHIVRLKGFPITSDLALHFQINADATVKGLSGDYMTRVANGNGMVQVDWPGLWQRSKGDPMGTFALYCRASDEDEDDTLLHIWAEEGLVHPKVDGEWNYDQAKKWIAKWQDEFRTQSRLRLLRTETPEDLHEWVKWAANRGCQVDLYGIICLGVEWMSGGRSIA